MRCETWKSRRIADMLEPEVVATVEPVHAEPVKREERVASVDVLRGFSLLGILLLNINSFGLPFSAYMNPTVAGGAEGWNLTTWLVAMTFWDGKMRCIFSMLFGTSAILLLDRAERRGVGIEAADIYYRRTMWLILIGMLHAYLIWYGDILYPYGVVGLLLFPLRRASAKALIIAGAAIIVIHSAQNVGAGFAMKEMGEKAAIAQKAEAEGKKLSKEDAGTLKEWKTVEQMFAPPKEEVAEEIKAHRGGWVSNLVKRAGTAATFEFTMFFQFMFLDVLGMLVLGMGLAKAGVFDASRSNGFYGGMAAIGFALGVPLNYWAASGWAKAGFDIPGFFTYLGATADPGRFLVAAGYIGVIMLTVKAGALRFVTSRLEAVGRMALSNYLLTSILMTFVFDGWGLGYFAKLERWQLLGVVVGMWTVNLVVSPLWLKRYRFGPAEWAWRSLTYWKRQPMRISEVSPIAS